MHDIDLLMIPPDIAILDAVARLETSHKRLLLVTAPDRRLLGVLSDSDVRRALLNQVDLQRPVADIMMKTPVTVGPDDPEELMRQIVRDTKIYQVPVVDGDGRVLDVRFVEDLLAPHDARPERVAVVMAGGEGRRLRPLTEDLPKPLLTVGDKPVLFTIIDQLLAADVDRIYITLNYKRHMIRNAVTSVRPYRARVSFIEEEQQLGTAGSLSLLPETPTGPFVVINGDVLTRVAIGEMIRFHELEANAVTVAVKEHKLTIPYGVIDVEGTRVVGLKEKPGLTHFLNTGVYVLDPGMLAHVEPDMPRDMTDLMDAALRTDQRVGCFPVHEYWVDIGGHNDLQQARMDYWGTFAGAAGRRS